MVVLGDEVKHPSGVMHGVGHIAPSLSACGSEHGDHPRETAKFLFVHDDHLTPVGCPVQPPFCVPQSGLHALELPANE
jgi:hypothetical protein